MPELADKQPSDEQGAFTAGCLLLLVLVADLAAALLVAIVLVARGWNRMGEGSARTAAGPPPDWAPVLGFGALALALGVTALVLLRIGNRGIGAVQLTLCVVLAVHTLRSWP
ncbi:inner-membrane translocator [Streptomyces massasporeus]|uniref:inner-membrane translocator n=1 Tax=Streptomyces massasporeus TaxID=67324 RepID=UPI0037F6EEA1